MENANIHSICEERILGGKNEREKKKEGDKDMELVAIRR
jgi:hypothetical protein